MNFNVSFTKLDSEQLTQEVRKRRAYLRKQQLLAKLEPFMDEIKSHGGEVEITFRKGLTGMDLNIKNLPSELTEKINSLLLN